MKSDTLFLINPLSAEGNSTKIWQAAIKGMPKRYQPIDVTKVTDVKRLLVEKKPKLLGVIGGDGTINSVCTAVLAMPKKYRPLIGVIPCGFGNALSYCLGVETIKESLDTLKNPRHTLAIDILQTNVPDKPLGIFNISVGFDARIVHSRMNDRYIGVRSYILSAVKSIITHPKKMLTITVDEVFTFRAVASSLVIANCPVIGKNFVIASDARLNDGFLDCTVFATKYAYVTNLRFKGFMHPLYSKGEKVFFKAKNLRITGDPFVQIDGDPFLQQGDVRISILPRALTFIRSSREKIVSEYQSFIE